MDLLIIHPLPERIHINFMRITYSINNGVISKRAREKEFSKLELKEIKVIEVEFKSIFMRQKN